MAGAGLHHHQGFKPEGQSQPWGGHRGINRQLAKSRGQCCAGKHKVLWEQGGGAPSRVGMGSRGGVYPGRLPGRDVTYLGLQGQVHISQEVKRVECLEPLAVETACTHVWKGEYGRLGNRHGLVWLAERAGDGRWNWRRKLTMLDIPGRLELVCYQVNISNF